MTLKCDGWPRETLVHLFYTTSSLCTITNPSVNSNWSHSPETLDLGSKSVTFLSSVTLKFDGWPWKTSGHLFCTTLSFGLNFKTIGELKLKLRPGNAQFGPKSVFIVPSDLAIWWMTSKNNRASLLYGVKLCPWFVKQSMNSDLSYSPETLNLGQNRYFLPHVNLKFDGGPWKTIRHLFYAASSFVHRFVGIGELKLELQSGTTHFG